MVAFKAHFDGKVIVPDEPVDLKTNERLMVKVEPDPSLDQPTKKFDFESLLGAALRAPLNPNPRFLTDDELWGE